MLRAVHRVLDRALLRPGAFVRFALTRSRRLRAWAAWRAGDLQHCRDALRRLRWLAPAERRVLRNCEDMLAVLQAPANAQHARATAASPSPHAGGDPLTVQFVLHSCQALHPSGYGRRSEALIAALRRVGVDVKPTLRLGYPLDLGMPAATAAQRLAASPTAYRRLPGIGLDRASEKAYIDAYAAALRDACVDSGARLIHAASNYLDGLAAAAAGAALDVPVVYEVRGLWHVTRATREPGYAASQHHAYCEAQELRACMAAERVVVLSTGVADHLVERGVPRRRIVPVPNAADVVPPAPAAIDALRRRLALPDGAKVFGYAGALVDYEGLPLLIDMLGDARLRSWHLVVAGHGADDAKLRQLAVQRGLAHRIRFAGYLPAVDVTALYTLLDACVVPRIDVALTRLVPSQKPYEALAHGCPVVASMAAASALEPALRERIVALDGRDAGTWVEGLLRAADAQRPSGPVPGWDARAETLLAVYRDLVA